MAANDPGDPGVISEGGSAAPDGVAVPDEAALPATRWWKRRIVKIGLWTVIAVFAWFALSRLIGAVDWLAVGSAFGRLQPWAMVLLLVALLVRQALNAVPLIYYVPGLRWGQSMRNDLAANVMATFAPPPSDIVLRVTMFRSWGLDPVMGIAGSTLNSFKFYAVRFLAPGLGLILLAAGGLERRRWVIAVLCLLVAGVILTALVLLLRSDALAAWLGTGVGKLVRLFKKSFEPEKLGQRTVELRAQAAGSLRRGLLPSMIALLGMVLADAAILAVALRGVGVSLDLLPLIEILGAFLLVYPLTTLPLFGLGVMDALLVGAWTTIAGVVHEPSIVAATIIWRVVTILGTLLLGLLVLGHWKIGHAVEAAQVEEAQGEGAQGAGS